MSFDSRALGLLVSSLHATIPGSKVASCLLSRFADIFDILSPIYKFITLYMNFH